MAKINLDGTKKAYEVETHYVPADSYEGRISEVSDVITTTYQGVSKQKTVLTIEIPDAKGKKKIPLKLWVALSVTKGSDGYSSSKLYELFEKASALEMFEAFVKDKLDENGELPDESLVEFIRATLYGREVKALVEVKNKDGTDYSVVKDIIKFLPQTEQSELPA
jgi:hypothetical protein